MKIVITTVYEANSTDDEGVARVTPAEAEAVEALVKVLGPTTTVLYDIDVEGVYE